MNSDQFAYEIFVVDPGSYFEMLGQPRSEAENYTFHAAVVKTIERRGDGYFEPKDFVRPLHFVEVLFYKKENAYANLFAKVFLKLEQEPARDWRAVIFFESRTLLPSVELPYENLLGSTRFQRVCINELPETPRSSFGLALLKLATKPKHDVARDANLLAKRLKREAQSRQKQKKILELLEFVVISRLTHLSRDEVRAMLDLEDYRKSRFYQEAKQDGVDEGKAESVAEFVLRLATKGYDAKQISELVGSELKTVRKILKSRSA